MAYGPEVMEEAFAESRILQKSSYARLLATTTLLGTCSPNRLVTRPPSFALSPALSGYTEKGAPASTRSVLLPADRTCAVASFCQTVLTFTYLR